MDPDKPTFITLDIFEEAIRNDLEIQNDPKFDDAFRRRKLVLEIELPNYIWDMYHTVAREHMGGDSLRALALAVQSAMLFNCILMRTAFGALFKYIEKDNNENLGS